MKTIKSCINRFGNFVFLCLCCLAWVGVLVQPAFSQNRNSITGFVFDARRNPVPQIYVEVMNEVNQVLQRTRTDGSGRFLFGGLSSGRFSVRVLPYGTDLEEQTQEVEIINFVRPGSSTSESAQKDFYLRVRRTGGTNPTITGTIFVQEIPAEAIKSYDKAVADFESGRQEAAMEGLLKAVKIFPEYFSALERLGREYIKQQKYDYAQAAFLKAVSVNGRGFNSWYGLSFACYALKQSETAVEAAQNALKLQPTSVEATLILGISFRQAKRYEEAEKSLLQAKKISKNTSADAHWNLALLYNHNLKRYQEAAAELEKYLELQPNDPRANDLKKLIAELRKKSLSPAKLT